MKHTPKAPRDLALSTRGCGLQPLRNRAAWAIAALALLAAESGVSAQGLALPLIPQRAKFWCWAASVEMVRDSFAAPPARASTGQCSIVNEVPEGKSCKCVTADLHDATQGGCDVGNPFDGKKDYIPGLLTAVRTKQTGSRAAIHPDLLNCEIHTRKRPVLTWWRNKPATCEKSGHIVVVADFLRQENGKELVLIHDPLPETLGDAYWLTWLGYACGYKLGGHCADYYDVAGPPEIPKSCEASPELDPLSCEGHKARFDTIPLADVEGAVSDLLGGELGARLRIGLGLAADGTQAECDRALLVHSAGIRFFRGAPVLFRLGSSRLVCGVEREGRRAPISILLIGAENEGWRLAGFGAEQTSRSIERSAESLVSSRLEAGPSEAVSMELYEVEIPGTGEVLLIDRTSPSLSSINLQRPELGARSLDVTLKDPLSGLGSPSLEVWLQSLPPGN